MRLQSPGERPLPPRALMAEAGPALSPEAEEEEEADEELLQLETEPPALPLSGRAARTAPGGAVRLPAGRDPSETASEEEPEGDGEESEPLLGAAAAGRGRRTREGTGERRCCRRVSAPAQWPEGAWPRLGLPGRGE